MRSSKRREKDQIFQAADRPVADFTFNAETASVFDDMLERSVPFYGEMQRMLAQLAGDFAADGTNIYDIGCSTGTTLTLLDALPQAVTLVGLDNSAAMLARAESALSGRLRHPYELRHADLNEGLSITDASAVVMSLTLQFVRPVHREGLLREVCTGINPEGCLLLIEKLVAQESLLNRLYIQHYYEFKQANGYSELEIARKREALENVLIPYRLEENDLMLRRAGFRAVDVFFKWYNFCGIIAVK
ncbi:MAG TPA: carboxy-S-adenosyl-L-methionine synthase CmoA [Candidatus Dormibacteraeota bacterium]|nr:carboxy-S-adenosyl-L-methionine synthase CmoA [Candidatus Dormibacteraeota bacterium]